MSDSDGYAANPIAESECQDLFARSLGFANLALWSALWVTLREMEILEEEDVLLLLERARVYLIPSIENAEGDPQVISLAVRLVNEIVREHKQQPT